jgi:tetratricopeptide (TPR) repeat protein
MAAPQEQSHVFATLALVALSILALSGLDTFLARMERSENLAESRRLDAAGHHLMEQGRPVEAIAQFKAGLAMERENPECWLDLGQAQLGAGQLTEAEATLQELLRRDSGSGPANLALARVLVKEGRTAEAVSAYHKAIYGRWDADAESSRIRVRWELVNLMAANGSKEDLLSELLPLLDVAPDDLAQRKRLGNLFLTAGSAARAAEIFRSILRDHPLDADAYAGLGEGEFARDNYLTAQGDFQHAYNLRPYDANIKERLDLATSVLALDPTRRGLSPDQQNLRSVQILQMASDAVERCGGTVPDEAKAALKTHQPLEATLDLAEEVWKIRQRTCKSPAEGPLSLVLAKIAQ